MNDHITTLNTTDRWRPTRAGLVALWRYWDETFVFHKGRLLLRGPNGSGKSMALELLLPFLLDGDTSPSKLTSAARPRGRLFDRVMTGSDESTRTGFAWVEFRRADQTFTAGARLKASRATDKVDVDLFTTNLAVGRDLVLLDANRTPLSKKALEEAIGTTGRVHDSAEEHRAAVREALFPAFGPDRYDSVIGALLALRKEKLSQNLDLDKLSEVLSEALPPIDDHDIAAVAEGFERLDRRRAALATLERDLTEVRQLARLQRDYSRAVVLGVAAQVRSSETDRDDVTRHERLAKEALHAAVQQSAATAAERQVIDDRDTAAQVDIEALKDSHAYRAGAELADLRAYASRLRDHACRAKGAAEDRARAGGQAKHDLEEAAGEYQRADANHQRAWDDVRAVASDVGADAVVAETETRAVDEPDDPERLIHAWVRAQRVLAGEVRAALHKHDHAVARRGFLDDQVAMDELAVSDRSTAVTAARASGAAAIDSYRAAVEVWCARSQALDAVRLATLPQPPEDPVAVSAAVGAIANEMRTSDELAHERLGVQRRARLAETTELKSEQARWKVGGLVDPDGPSWRTTRASRPGAPLWRLVDVASGIAPADIDGLEGALVGAGLLDAWVTPDGRCDLGPGRCDVVLTAVARPGPTLSSLLVPAADPTEALGVPAEVIASVLASIALVPSALEPVVLPTAGADVAPARGGVVAPAGNHDVVAAAGGLVSTEDGAGRSSQDLLIGADGTYKVGSAVGRGPIRPAMVLGVVARERHRVARLAELAAAIAVVAAHLIDLDRQEAARARERAALDAELAAVPSGDAVHQANQAMAAATTRLAEAQDRLDSTRAARRGTEDAVRAALRDLTGLAARHGLPTDRSALDRLEVLLGQLREAAGTWARRRHERVSAERRQLREAERMAEAERAESAALANHAAAEQEARDVERRVATLDSSIGAEVAHVQQRIALLADQRRVDRRRSEELVRTAMTLERRLGELSSQVDVAVAERARAESDRDLAHRRLVACIGALGGDCGIQPSAALDTATGVLSMARSLAADYERAATDKGTVTRLSERVREKVYMAQAALGARVDLDRQIGDGAGAGDRGDGDWLVLRTTSNGIRRRVSDLASALKVELDEGQSELAAEEQRLFEETLAGSVRRALATRIRQANALVDGINKQLSEVRTAAGGVEVRLRWEVDPDQLGAVKAARSLLLKDPRDLLDSERSSLQDFVRARVDQARAELEANAPWEARLRETLDYRAWHRFSLQLAHRDWDGFLPATSRRLQKLSTGERSIALHLPMIASLAAHYADEGQSSGCPRLILLDELFAGVDTANRAQLFGTFSTWDLDAVFTSDHEWCQYSSLDGIAIHHLHPPIGDDPVTSTRFTWDGRRRQIDTSAA